MGEGWHNYHHVFPWDYKAAELGGYKLNNTKAFIDFFAKIGWAYDLKSPSPELIKKISARYGDGSHPEQQTDAIDQKAFPQECPHPDDENHNLITDKME